MWRDPFRNSGQPMCLSTCFFDGMTRNRILGPIAWKELDHSLVLYGSAMRATSITMRRCRSCSRAVLQASQWRTLSANPKDTTMSNLLLAMLGKLNIEADHFGDSTGAMEI